MKFPCFTRTLSGCLGGLSLIGATTVHGLEIAYLNRGADGDFRPTGATYEVDLSKARDGKWDDATPDHNDGIYDASKWAVVFKYASIEIPAGTTVVFKNHRSRAPVVWLVDGDATVAGVVNLDGANGNTDGGRFLFSEPGPGGFRGGDKAKGGVAVSSGFGPGGGFWMGDDFGVGTQSHGSYATAGVAQGSPPPGPTYGNPFIQPLVGGSGGPGGSPGHGGGGGAGGGALALLTRGSLQLDGTIFARGGVGPGSFWVGGSAGSGGAIRLAAQSITGKGTLAAGSQGLGGNGRILLESPDFTASLDIYPSPTFRVPEAIAIWPPTNAPTARIVSVSDRSAPSDPRAFMGPVGTADVMLQPGRKSVVVTIETQNLPPTSTVTLRLTPRHGFAQLFSAEHSGPGAAPGSELWTRTFESLPTGYYALQAVAKAP